MGLLVRYRAWRQSGIRKKWVGFAARLPPNRTSNRRSRGQVRRNVRRTGATVVGLRREVSDFFTPTAVKSTDRGCRRRFPLCNQGKSYLYLFRRDSCFDSFDRCVDHGQAATFRSMLILAGVRTRHGRAGRGLIEVRFESWTSRNRCRTGSPVHIQALRRPRPSRQLLDGGGF